MRALVAALDRYARAEANLLITGETGSGKDLVARTLHDLSPRATAPFVVVDCPGLPASLFESELFGHERGAFTDATVARPGRFEQAANGTVYLDRVDELSLDAQAKLLRLVERKQVERLGSSVSVPVRARVVASATSDMEHAVREGRFRMDLYHRLRVLPLHVPPLRERGHDFAPLARRLLADSGRAATRSRPPRRRPRGARGLRLAGQRARAAPRAGARAARAGGRGHHGGRPAAGFCSRRNGSPTGARPPDRRSRSSSGATSRSSSAKRAATRPAPPRCSASAARPCGRSASGISLIIDD